MNKRKLALTLRTNWLNDLRSGTFVKCTGSLSEKQPDGTYRYCPLGVLRVELVKAGLSSTHPYHSMHHLDLPGHVVDAVWMNNDESPEGKTRTGLTFAQTADYLEWVFDQFPVRSAWNRFFGERR